MQLGDLCRTIAPAWISDLETGKGIVCLNTNDVVLIVDEIPNNKWNHSLQRVFYMALTATGKVGVIDTFLLRKL